MVEFLRQAAWRFDAKFGGMPVRNQVRNITVADDYLKCCKTNERFPCVETEMRSENSFGAPKDVRSMGLGLNFVSTVSLKWGEITLQW